MADSTLAAALLGGQSGVPAAAFLDPAVAQATPDIQLGTQMIQQGLSTAPASPWQALARIAQAGAGTYLQRSGLSDLAKAYARTPDSMAATLPEGSPLRTALESPDPLVRMQAMQAYEKVLVLRSQPETLSPGQERKEGPATTASNTRARSELGQTQEDIDNASRRAAVQAPAAAPVPARNAGVPLAPPRFAPTTIGDVTGMSAPVPAPVNPPPAQQTSFNDRFNAARPTSVPSNPLQGAIDVKAAQTEANKRAEANVEYGDLIKPQPAPQPGPGGTEPVEVFHNNPRTNVSQRTLIPGIKDQGPLPNSPAAAKEAIPAWQKTETGFTSGLQVGQDAEQRLNSIADAFKTIKTGWGTEQKAHVNAILKSAGMPELFADASPKDAELAAHNAYIGVLRRLQQATQGSGSRFAQMEFKLLSENSTNPEIQPEANLAMLTQDLSTIRQANAMANDWTIAKRDYGWKNPQSFQEAWLRHNPIEGFTETAKKEIGPLKGMQGAENNKPATQAPTVAAATRYQQLVAGGMTKPEAFARMHSEGY